MSKSSSAHKEYTIDDVRIALFNQSGNPTPALLELLKKTDIMHDGSLENIVQETQKYWLRKPETERWDIPTTDHKNKEEFYNLFKKLCCIQQVSPKYKFYDYVIVLGATVTNFRKRLAYLIALSNMGITFNTIVILVGQRPLHEKIESKEILLEQSPLLPVNKNWQFSGNLPKTETDMAKLVFAQTELPDIMKKSTLIFIDTPGKIGNNQQFLRPTTGDTIAEWLGERPKPGSCLAISIEPHVGYQDTVMRTYLDEKIFPLDTVGSAIDVEKENISTILDNLARWLYQLKQLKKLI